MDLYIESVAKMGKMSSSYDDCCVQAFGCTMHTCIHTHTYTHNYRGIMMLTKKSETALPKSVFPARSNLAQPFNILCLPICLLSVLFRSFSVHSSRITEQLRL